MIFSSLLHIFQSEHYDRKRFFLFVYSHADWWNFSVRGKTDWTLRAKLLMSIATGVFFIFLLFVFLSDIQWYQKALSIVIAIFAFPIFLILADISIAPIVSWQKKKILISAKNYKNSLDITTIAITGSYGKTSMKTILQSVLSQQFSVFTIPGNINTDLGIAQYILSHSKELEKADILLLEIGAYKKGEIATVCSFIKPDYSVLTAIAPVHLERFGSLQNIIEAKMELPQNTQKKSYFCMENEQVKKIFLESSCDHYVSIDSSKAKEHIQFLPDFAGFSFEWASVPYQTKLLAQHSLEQIITAIEIATELKMPTALIQKGILEIPYPDHRLALTKNPYTQVTVIDDSYNGNEAGFLSGLSVLSRAGGRKIVMTPGIVELGKEKIPVHVRLAEEYIKNVDLLLMIDNSNTRIIEQVFYQKFFKNYRIYSSVQKAHADLPNILQKGDTILFQNDLPDNYR